MITIEEQQERARRAHRSITPELNTPTILLKKPPFQILHQYTQQMVDDEIEFWPEEFRNRWYSSRDHYLLDEMMREGALPDGWPENTETDSAPDLGQAWKTASRLGYSVDEARHESKEPSYGESEAWAAAQMLVRGDITCFKDQDFRHGTGRNWTASVRQLTGSFLIPNLSRPTKSPFIADQLWIVKSDKGVRKIVLEIDGEQHLTPEHQSYDAWRDLIIQGAGYEVYRVAAWWARIDGYRVISEFLHHSGLLPKAPQMLIFGNATYPSDYHCAKCGKEMVRWDVDWITYDEEGYPIHSECSDL